MQAISLKPLNIAITKFSDPQAILKNLAGLITKLIKVSAV